MVEHDMQPHMNTWKTVTRIILYGALGTVAVLALLAISLIAG